MTIMWNNLKRILRNKLNIIFMIIVPVIMISLIASLGGLNKGDIICGIVDYDDTRFTQQLVENMKQKSKITIINEDQIQDKLTELTIDCAIVVEKGFTEGLIAGRDVKIRSYSIQETNMSMPVMLSIESYLNAARSIAASADNNTEKFYTGMEYYKNGNLSLNYNEIDVKKDNTEKTVVQLGFLVMSMLFLSSFAPMIMIQDRVNRTIYRVISSPISIKSIMFQNILSFFIISVAQVLLMFLFMTQVLKVDMGPSVLNMLLLSLLFSLVCTSLGTAINSISTDSRQSALISSLMLSPMCMLGGCWWPFDIMPSILKKVANFVPTTWIMRGYEKVIKGNSLQAALNEILVLLLFSVIFFLLSSWRKNDIAKN